MTMNDPKNSIHEFKLNPHPKALDNIIITTIFIGGRGALGIGWLPENIDDPEEVRPSSYNDDFWDRAVQEITIVQDDMKVANIRLPLYCSLTPRSLNDYAKDLNKFKEEVMTKNMSEHEKVKLKEQALAKLTWEEIQILGIEMP
jgi:hypothetical protein